VLKEGERRRIEERREGEERGEREIKERIK
jgi:hypothetical protein